MSKTIINTAQAPAAIGPYSQAVLKNDTLYCSGQIAIDPSTGNLVLDSIENETHRVFQNVKALLTEANMDFSNVVKTSIFLSDMNDFATINTIYAEYFVQPYPARETVQVAKLPKGVNVEVSVIACR